MEDYNELCPKCGQIMDANNFEIQPNGILAIFNCTSTGCDGERQYWCLGNVEECS